MNILAHKIGFRYSYARRGSQFVGLNAILAIVGIAIGIAALIVVLSVMNGVMVQVRDKMLSMTAQVSLRSYSDDRMVPLDFDPKPYLSPITKIRAWAPYIQGQGLIGDGQSFQGVVLQGIDPTKEDKVSSTFAQLDEATRARLVAGEYGIILGKSMAEVLDAHLGDKITVIVPQVTASAAGLLPRLKRFTLLGTFSSGHYQFDNQMAWIHIADASKLLQLPDGISGYHIRIDDPMHAPLIRDQIQPHLPYGIFASDWSRDQSSYFSAVQTEKHAMFIILCLIVIVAAFGLLSSMYMVVTEKQRDIAILRTMGMTRAEIRKIFLTQGMVFGGLGMMIGLILGVVLSLNVPNVMNLLREWTGYELPAKMYFINELPAKIDPVVIIGVSVVTLILTLLFSVIPAQIAAKTEPARALSHE